MTRRLHDLVSVQADRRPDKVAVVLGSEMLTYGALESLSNRLANLLRETGLRPGDRVCLFVAKTPVAIVGILGVLKAGGVYVPIDPGSPASRAAKIVQACDPAFILVQRQTASLLDGVIAEATLPRLPTIVALDRERLGGGCYHADFDLTDVAGASASACRANTTADDLAHILFTSGSTGAPKGVMIAHRSVTAFLRWACRSFGLSPRDQISGHPPLHFDLSTFDIYGTLASGATLHLVPSELNLVPGRLATFIRASRLTQWFSVPTILTHLAKADAVAQHDFPALKRLLWCGEVMPTPTLIYWMRRLPHVRFTNLYGPTETTIASSHYTLEAVPDDEHDAIPIGRACEGEQLHVLDDDLCPVAPEAAGHLYVSGVGLSQGYWRDPVMTGRAFVADPNLPARRLYRTGDLARMDATGLVYFLGRRDSQIKSRGYRIELEEIETALRALPCVREGAVIGVETGGFEGTSICCAYVPTPSTDSSPQVIRRDLARMLPAYMLPVHWKAYDRLPTNGNGKIDRRAISECFAEEIREVRT